MVVSTDEVEHWRNRILADPIASERALDELEMANHARFLALCRVLATDPSESVRRIALRKLGQRGDRDDADAETAAMVALDQPMLRGTALFALGRVGTPRSFCVLLAQARAGSDMALASAAEQARTQEEVEDLLALARQHLMAPGSAGFQLRVESLPILLRFSSAQAERDIVLEAARRYADDFVIAALADADDDVLEEMKAMRSHYPSESVEYRAFSSAIGRIEERKIT